MGRLEDKIAIVFGAGPNLGGTVAHFLAREGAAVAVSDLDLEAAKATASFLTERGFQSIAIAGDAQSEADVAAIVSKTVETFGGVDVAFNMAGRVHWSPILDMRLEDWQDAVLSFPTAGLLTTRHVAKAMIDARRKGSIIHLLSTAAHFGQPSGAAYCTAKAGLLNFARCAAMELAQYEIRVNTITPCAMEHQLWTKMRNEVESGTFVRQDNRPQYSRDSFYKNIPMGRFPRASDVAWAAVFLASDESAFLTGTDIPVDGGLRFKYPTWQPGDHYGRSFEEYVHSLERTAYGETLKSADNGDD